MAGFAVEELIAERIVSIARAVTQFVRINRIEVRCVSWMNDFRLERRLLTSQFFRPVNLIEERMVFNLIDIFSDSILFTLA